MSNSLAAKMRARLNKRAGKEISKAVTTTSELLQVEAWIEMPDYFNKAAGGKGYPAGHITQIVGDSDTGKTTLLMVGMISTQKAGGIVYLIDSEHKFSFERFKAMGGVSEDIIVLSVDSLEQAWNSWDSVCKEVEQLRSEKDGKDIPVLAAWDSVAASVPDRILEEEDSGDSHVSVEAKINNKNIRKLRQRIRNIKIAAVFINHTYWSMPKFGIAKEIVKGGSEMFFMSSLILKTKRKAWLDREYKGLKQRFGAHSLLEVMKGHLGGRRTTTEFYIVSEGVLDDKKALDEYKESMHGKE